MPTYEELIQQGYSRAEALRTIKQEATTDQRITDLENEIDGNDI